MSIRYPVTYINKKIAQSKTREKSKVKIKFEHHQNFVLFEALKLERFLAMRMSPGKERTNGKEQE